MLSLDYHSVSLGLFVAWLSVTLIIIVPIFRVMTSSSVPQSFARFSLWMLRICSMAMVQKCVPQGHFGVGAGRTDSPYLRVLCYSGFFKSPKDCPCPITSSYELQFCHIGIHLLTFRLSRRRQGVYFTPLHSQSGPLALVLSRFSNQCRRITLGRTCRNRPLVVSHPRIFALSVVLHNTR